MHKKRPHYIGFTIVARDENNAPEVRQKPLKKRKTESSKTIIRISDHSIRELMGNWVGGAEVDVWARKWAGPARRSPENSWKECPKPTA